MDAVSGSPTPTKMKILSTSDFAGALAFALLVAAGLSGCAGTTAPTSASGDTLAAPGAGTGQATVKINGQDQHFGGQVTCRTDSGMKVIYLGPPPTNVSLIPPDGTGQIIMSDTNPPTLNLATAKINGVLIFAGAGSGGSGNGQVSANGDSYTVTGELGTGTLFEIDTTCA